MDLTGAQGAVAEYDGVGDGAAVGVVGGGVHVADAEGAPGSVALVAVGCMQ